MSNFDFLQKHSPQLTKLGVLAERYFATDPPAALIKLHQFAEFSAKAVAARHAALPLGSPDLDDLLRTLRARSVMPREIGELFFHLKRAGNAAAHEDKGSPGEALTALKIARAIGVWLHQIYAGEASFRPGPFVPPTPPADADAALHTELEAMRRAVADSTDAQAKARLAIQQAEEKEARLSRQAEKDAQARVFWERYAARRMRTDSSNVNGILGNAGIFVIHPNQDYKVALL